MKIVHDENGLAVVSRRVHGGGSGEPRQELMMATAAVVILDPTDAIGLAAKLEQWAYGELNTRAFHMQPTLRLMREA